MDVISNDVVLEETHFMCFSVCWDMKFLFPLRIQTYAKHFALFTLSMANTLSICIL